MITVACRVYDGNKQKIRSPIEMVGEFMLIPLFCGSCLHIRKKNKLLEETKIVYFYFARIHIYKLFSAI